MCGSIHMVPDRPLCRTGLKFRFWPERADSRPSSSGRNRCTTAAQAGRVDNANPTAALRCVSRTSVRNGGAVSVAGVGRTQTVSVFAFSSIIHWRAAQRRINQENRKPQFLRVDVHSGNTVFQCAPPAHFPRVSPRQPEHHQRARPRHHRASSPTRNATRMNSAGCLA